MKTDRSMLPKAKTLVEKRADTLKNRRGSVNTSKLDNELKNLHGPASN